MPTTPIPTEIGRANEHDIRIVWNTGDETIFPARLLRLACPCASCVEEMTGQKILDDTTVPEDVHPLGIQPVGRYAIQINWSDGHSTGMYTWERLWDLAQRIPK
jgi:DUF971 family protein